MSLATPTELAREGIDPTAKQRLCVVSETHVHADEIAGLLPDFFSPRPLGLADLAHCKPDALVLVDMRLNSCRENRNGCRELLLLKSWLKFRPDPGFVLFAIDRNSRVQIVQALSLGASDVLFRPLTKNGLHTKLLSSLATRTNAPPSSDTDKKFGYTASLFALQSIFSSASEGRPIDAKILVETGDALVNQIETCGFSDWIRNVRAHHDQTYKHCLLVAGASAAFAIELGFNCADRRRAATAGLLHDVGKAKIPIAILDKPAKLDHAEMEIVKQHPHFGYEALQGNTQLQPELLEIVMNHHEYLDGSGYPRGLQGHEISDLTRIVTIADIFSAMIEHRTYKPSVSGPVAYETLSHMGAKLDRDLVRAFKPLSRVNPQPIDV